MIDTNQDEYSTDFLIVRRAVFENFIARNAPIQEAKLTPHHICMIVYEIGKWFAKENKAGLTEVPEDLE